MTSCATIQNRSYETSYKQGALEANIKLAFALLKQGYYKEARQQLFIVREFAPDCPAVWYSMGLLNESEGELIAAEKNYRYALRLDPQSGAAHNNYGTFLCRIGKYKESIMQFQQAVLDNNYVDAALTYENAGICALKIPDKIKAKLFFQKAINHDPKLTKSNWFLQQL